MRVHALIALLVIMALCSGAQAAEYKLGPGDTISVKVLDFDNLSSEVKVQPDGDVTLPLVGAVTADGKTAPRLADDLKTKYAEYVVKPSVSVIITEFRQDVCTVLGQVLKPGPTTIADGTTVRGALAAAGGTLDKADTGKITLARGSATIAVDLTAAATDPKVDVVVQPGDVLMVPEATSGVLVLGSVTKSGTYDWKEGMRIMDALSAAGGLLEDADGASAMLATSDGKQTPVKLNDLLQKGAMDQNLPVHRGDVLYVPRQEQRYYVFGEVGKAGQYPIKGADKLVEVLGTAGGTTATADLSAIGVVRIVDGKPEVVRADLGKFARSGDQSQNVEIRPSDVVFVPAKKSKFTWASITGPLSIASLLFTLRR